MARARPAKKTDTLTARVYNSLKSMIVSGEVPLEEPLAERVISHKLGVSRTPVKHALSRLQQEGLVKIVPRQGVYPVKISFAEYLHILRVREVLEGLAARLAVDHVSNAKLRELRSIFSDLGDVRDVEKVSHETYALANVTFHREILYLSSNPKLVETVQGLYDHMSLLRLRTIETTGRRLKSITEHEAILESLENRDPDQAEQSMRSHIRALIQDIENEARRNPDFFRRMPDQKEDCTCQEMFGFLTSHG